MPPRRWHSVQSFGFRAATPRAYWSYMRRKTGYETDSVWSSHRWSTAVGTRQKSRRDEEIFMIAYFTDASKVVWVDGAFALVELKWWLWYLGGGNFFSVPPPLFHANYGSKTLIKHKTRHLSTVENRNQLLKRLTNIHRRTNMERTVIGWKRVIKLNIQYCYTIWTRKYLLCIVRRRRRLYSAVPYWSDFRCHVLHSRQ